MTAAHPQGAEEESLSFPRIVVLVNKAVPHARAGNGVGNPLPISALRGFLILSSRKSWCRYCRALMPGLSLAQHVRINSSTNRHWDAALGNIVLK